MNIQITRSGLRVSNFFPDFIYSDFVRKLFVRGLCRESIFDNEYLYNINMDGSILYMGITSSIVIYNKVRRFGLNDFVHKGPLKVFKGSLHLQSGIYNSQRFL